MTRSPAISANTPPSMENFKGATLMIASSSCFTANDAVIKFLSDGMPIGEVLFFRGLLVILFIAVIMRVRGESIRPAPMMDRANLARAAVEVAITYIFLTAVILLPLAIATVLVFTTPIFLTIAAALLFGERVGPPRWAAVLAGFLGVVLIADPAGSFEPLMLIPVVAAVLMAGRDVLTRMIAPQLPARAVALTSAIAVTVSGLLTWPLGGWVQPTAGDWTGIVICAGFVAAAHTLLVGAVRIGEMSFVAPFRYTSILLAVLVGYAVWGDVPGPMAILGGLVIVASGIVIFYRERRRMAQEEKARTT
ncbi:MAG: DMT family transporter [Geminicoccaceae bacterium]|nr:DMT family transporter [Geminicoccaceae bacterium]